jgi:hypothetical protein
VNFTAFLSNIIGLLVFGQETKIKNGRTLIMDQIKTIVSTVTEVFIALLALAIVASLLVGADNMAFLGDVAGNITQLVASLGEAGLPGLIALGIILMLFRKD